MIQDENPETKIIKIRWGVAVENFYIQKLEAIPTFIRIKGIDKDTSYLVFNCYAYESLSKYFKDFEDVEVFLKVNFVEVNGK